MLHIKNLHASIDGIEILNGIDLVIPKGEVHAIMGPNGSGKSTLAKVISGDERYKTTGEILFDTEDISDLAPEDRAQRGLFLGFQHPVEIPGVYLVELMRAAKNARLKYLDEDPVDAIVFHMDLSEKLADLNLNPSWVGRGVNEGFSGGERKRSEILQMAVLEPKLAVLDEIDSGLDVDSLKEVSKAIESMRSPDRSILLITHYARILDQVKPDKVHIMKDGKIVRSGGPELAKEIEENGYEN